MVLVWPDVSKSLWNSVTQNEEDFSCMFDETTPLKACGDLTYNVAPIGTDCITLPPPPHPPKMEKERLEIGNIQTWCIPLFNCIWNFERIYLIWAMNCRIHKQGTGAIQGDLFTGKEAPNATIWCWGFGCSTSQWTNIDVIPKIKGWYWHICSKFRIRIML